MEGECIFCQIIQKKSPAKIVYEDEEVVAFWDIRPSAPIHLLIIPKKHLASLNEVKEADQLLLGKLLLVAKKLAAAHKIDRSGFRVVINTGPWAGQIVNHLHLHLMGGG